MLYLVYLYLVWPSRLPHTKIRGGTTRTPDSMLWNPKLEITAGKVDPA
jgi:hypothetical protein